MRIEYLSASVVVKKETPIALCLGFFDGVHLGHLALVNRAKETGLPVAVLTFHAHSLKQKRAALTTLEDKATCFEKAGVTVLYVLTFDETIQNLSPEAFVVHILKPLCAAHFIIGEDYRFGKKQSGDAAALRRLTADFACVHEVSPIIYAQKKISSSDIVSAIEAGDIETANFCLGRAYGIRGIVQQGLRNGHHIGYPTANIHPSFDYAYPKRGVYYGYSLIDGKKVDAMINVGIHPTVSPLNQACIEAHFFDASMDLYGKEITIFFVIYLREEIAFPSLNALKQQLQMDAVRCRDYRGKL